MDLDALLLSRLQFAFTIAFHILFPAFTIGLASYLAVLEGLWLWTGREVYLDVFRYWLKVFAVNFAMGVVSGIVLSYQFGTNWSVFADRTGPVLGPVMAYEVLTAFFLEAGFLGVMLFGLGRVGKGLHFAATCLVAIGTLISAFWFPAANSWMQTPVGFSLTPEGRFVPEDWWAIVFNPSFPYRLLQPLAKRDLVADDFHARREGDVTFVEMALHAVPAGMVHLVAGNLGQVVGVREVRVVVARRDDGRETLRRAA